MMIKQGSQGNCLPAPKFRSVASLVEKESVKDIRARAKAALIGAFVADAACMGLHWVPTQDVVQILNTRGLQCRPEFVDPPATKQYMYPVGSLSPLADELLPLLQSMTQHGGFYGPHFLQACHAAYTAYKGFQTPLAKRIVQAVNSGERYPWAACADNSVQCLLKIPAIAVRYGGKAELVEKAHDAVRAHQDHSDARLLGIAFARILERIFLGQSIAEVLVWASMDGGLDDYTKGLVMRALQAQNEQHADFVARVGAGSQATVCFMGVMHAAACSATYADAVRKTATAGGESCGRAQLVGAMFAAQDGFDCIPRDWGGQVTRLKELEVLTDQLISQRAIIELC